MTIERMEHVGIVVDDLEPRRRSSPSSDSSCTAKARSRAISGSADGCLASEASQGLQLAFEGGRGLGAAGYRNHERGGDPGGVHRERLVEELLVVSSIGGEGEPGLRICL